MEYFLGFNTYHKGGNGSNTFPYEPFRDSSIYTTLHYTTLHCTTLYYTALHYTTLHYTSLHYTTLHYTTLHCTTLHCTTLHCPTLHYTTLHCTTPHHTTPYHTTLHNTGQNKEKRGLANLVQCTYRYRVSHLRYEWYIAARVSYIRAPRIKAYAKSSGSKIDKMIL